MRTAAAAAAATALAVAVTPAVAGCGQEAIVVVVANPTDAALAVPEDAKTLTLVVSARRDGSFLQQVLGPFDLEADAAGTAFPFEVALLPGDAMDGEVIASAYVENAAGLVTATGSVVATFERFRIVRAVVTLSRTRCPDDTFEALDDPPFGASIDALLDGQQPDLRLCADDADGADLFNVLLPQGQGLVVVFHGSVPAATLRATLSCPGSVPDDTEVVPNNFVTMAPDPTLYRTCTLAVTYAKGAGGEPPVAVDAAYGFSLSTYGGGGCMDDPYAGQPEVPIDATMGAAESPSMVLCPVTLDTFAVKVGLNRVVSVNSVFDGGTPITGTLLCPGGAGSTGVLPLFGRTGDLAAGKKAEVETCYATLYGARAPVPYVLEARSVGLDTCVLDPAEEDDTPEQAVDVVDAGWMTPSAGGATPPLAVCAYDASGDDDDWFAFDLAGVHASMQIEFAHDPTLDGGDIDLEVRLPGPAPTSLLAAGAIDTLPIPEPPPGRYLLRFVCLDRGAGCANVYRFRVSLE